MSSLCGQVKNNMGAIIGYTTIEENPSTGYYQITPFVHYRLNTALSSFVLSFSREEKSSLYSSVFVLNIVL